MCTSLSLNESRTWKVDILTKGPDLVRTELVCFSMFIREIILSLEYYEQHTSNSSKNETEKIIGR